MTTITEDMLDALHDLQQKRLNDIHEHGQDFHLTTSEKSMKGLHDPAKGTVTFPAGTVLQSGNIIEGKSGALYIAGLTSKAGVLVAEVLPILGELETMAAKSGSFTRAGSVPVLSRGPGEIGTPCWGAPSIGSVVKSGGMLLRVAGVRRNGPVTVLQVQPLPAEKSLPQKTNYDYRSEVARSPVQMVNSIGGPIRPR